MSTDEVEESRLFRSAPERLWQVVADTDRLNRAAGMERVSLAPASLPSAARLVGRTRLAGIDAEYEELPFEWALHRSFSVERRYRTGPVERLRMAFALAPEGSGTRLTARLSFVGRWPGAGVLLRMQGRATLSALLAVIEEGDAALVEGRPLPVVGPVVLDDPALTRAAGGLFAALPPERRAIADRLVDHVRRASDAEVGRLRPYVLADRWGVPRAEALAVCLAAVRAGLLELRWELICPGCQTASDRPLSLTLLREHATCDLCELGFDLDLDRAVEVAFSPTPAVRAREVGPWCSGGPAAAPHVLAQGIVPAHQQAELPVPASAAGSLRVFLRGGRTWPIVVEAGAPAQIDADGDGPLRVAPGGRIRVHNPEAGDRHARLERLVWAEAAASAADVIAMPGFRRDFSTECLAPGVTLRVGRVALLFSDLTDSTQLYADLGDPAAWRLVQDHFEVVIGEIERHHGTLVKTIGDAVMAAFADEGEALAASIALLRAFEVFRASAPGRARVRLKLGIHSGTCFAVSANGILDYFGQTVNIAARLQGAAAGSEVVVSDELFARVGGVEGASIARFSAALKGVPEPVAAVRLTIAPYTASSATS